MDSPPLGETSHLGTPSARFRLWAMRDLPPSILLLLAASALSACGGADMPEAIDEAAEIVILGEEAAGPDGDAATQGEAGGEYLNPARDPEGDQVTGEPEGAAARDSTNDVPGTDAEPSEVVDEDAQPGN